MISRLMFLLIAALLIGGTATGLGTIRGSAQEDGASADGAVEADGRGGPDNAKSYINPDTGLPTENPNVKRNSECRTPDQTDRQELSDPGSTNNNVHNDACLTRNGKRFDGKASFEIKGVGEFSVCPDPDGAGPKTSAIKNNGKRCYMTGYQETGMDGDDEYHARINNTMKRGESNVTFCFDPDDNGCGDANVKDSILIKWMR